MTTKTDKATSDTARLDAATKERPNRAAVKVENLPVPTHNMQVEIDAITKALEADKALDRATSKLETALLEAVKAGVTSEDLDGKSTAKKPQGRLFIATRDAAAQVRLSKAELTIYRSTEEAKRGSKKNDIVKKVNAFVLRLRKKIADLEEQSEITGQTVEEVAAQDKAEKEKRGTKSSTQRNIYTRVYSELMKLEKAVNKDKDAESPQMDSAHRATILAAFETAFAAVPREFHPKDTAPAAKTEPNH